MNARLVAGSRWGTRLGAILGLYVIFGGVTAFFGWALDFRRLTDWCDTGVSIQPNATVCVTLSGVALLALSARRRRLAAVFGAVVAFIGGATLLEWLTGVDLGIDARLMFNREWGRGGVIVPGRMGPPGSLSWMLIGAALVLSARVPRLRRLAPALALVTTGISALSLVGYLYQVDVLFMLPRLTVIAFQTATFIMAVSLGIITNLPDREPMRTLLDAGAAGTQARRVLPLIVILPVALGFLRVAGQRAGWFDTGTGTALLVLVLVALLLSLTWWSLAAVRRHEQALFHSKQELRQKLDTAAVGLVRCSRDFRYVTANPAYAAIAGVPLEKIVGRPLVEVMGERAFELIRPRIERVLRGERVEYEAELPWAATGPRWIYVIYTPWYDGSGNVTGWVASVSDITQRKAAEAQVARNQQTFFDLVERAPFGIYVVDSDFRVAHMNAGSQVGAFRNVQPVIGRDFAEATRILWPGPVATQVIGAFRHTLETGEPYCSKDFTNPRDDVEAIESYEWELHRTTLPDGHYGVVCYYFDSTLLRQAEQRLRHRAEQVQALLDATPLGVYLVDADFRIAQVNPVALPVFGDVPGGVVGRDFDEIIHILWEKNYADEIVRIFRHTLDTGEPYVTPERAEYRIDRDKTEYYEWRLDRITLPEGQFGLVCYFRDISRQVMARKALEESQQALREADRRKDEFLATLAHELRNPLAPLRSGLQVMKLARNNGETVEHCRAMMERQLGQMVRLVDDLLDVSRISRGKVELRKERVELAKVVQDAVDTSRPLIEQAGQDLNITVPAQPVFVDADATRLAQVISNLLNNAAKYTDPGGHVTLAVERQGRDVVVTVRDTGVGIPGHMLPKLFEMFTQVDRSLEKSRGGLGIGLSLVKKLVELHGGSVEARSEGYGMGSEFVVRLPVVLSLAGEQRGKNTEEGLTVTARRRILVVDDNRDSALSLAMMLKLMGNETQTAHDGLEALDVAAAFRPDVVLLDIGMPKLNGYDAARLIREQSWGRSMVLVACTGWGQDDDKRRSQESGFDFHMIKPVEPATLDKLLAGLRVETV